MVTIAQKSVDVPQVEFVDKTVEVPAQMKDQVPSVTKGQKLVVTIARKSVEVLKVEFADNIDKLLVQKRFRVPLATVVQKLVEVPQVDKIAKTTVASATCPGHCECRSWAPVHCQSHAVLGIATAYSSMLLECGKDLCGLLLTWPKPYSKRQITACAMSHLTFGEHHCLDPER